MSVQEVVENRNASRFEPVRTAERMAREFRSLACQIDVIVISILESMEEDSSGVWFQVDIHA